MAIITKSVTMQYPGPVNASELEISCGRNTRTNLTHFSEIQLDVQKYTLSFLLITLPFLQPRADADAEAGTRTWSSIDILCVPRV